VERISVKPQLNLSEILAYQMHKNNQSLDDVKLAVQRPELTEEEIKEISDNFYKKIILKHLSTKDQNGFTTAIELNKAQEFLVSKKFDIFNDILGENDAKDEIIENKTDDTAGIAEIDNEDIQEAEVKKQNDIITIDTTSDKKYLQSIVFGLNTYTKHFENYLENYHLNISNPENQIVIKKHLENLSVLLSMTAILFKELKTIPDGTNEQIILNGYNEYIKFLKKLMEK
jgi:hypothetical protein